MDIENAPISVSSVSVKDILELPAGIIDDAALGLCELPELFVRYGYTPASAEVFRNHPVFERTVAARQAEMSKEGLTHKAVCHFGADIAAREFIRRIDPSMPITALTDGYKMLSKNAGLEPKGAETAVAGSMVSIRINLGGYTPPHEQNLPNRVIDVTPTAAHDINPAEFEIE